MSPKIQNELGQVERTLTSWYVQLWLMWGGTAVLGTMLVLGSYDLAFQAGYGGRWLGFILMAAIVTGIAVRLTVAIRRHLTSEGIAAILERAFPELDNRLINYIQFSRQADGDPLKAAYVRTGAPELNTLDISRMKNQRAHRNGRIAIVLAALLLLLPMLFAGSAWTTALWRMVNPFSSAAPVSLTHILDVDPGHAEVLQGEALVLTARVEGMHNHKVKVEVAPDDAGASSYVLGQVKGEGVETFSHRIPEVNASLRYRFRAGDAPSSEWYTITPTPPPAFTAITLDVSPPDYTGRPSFQRDARSGSLFEIPMGSRVEVSASSNTRLEHCQLSILSSEPVRMRFDAEQEAWKGEMLLREPSGALQIEGVDTHDRSLSEAVEFSVLADDPPQISVLSPEGRPVLPRGDAPRIVFRVEDDYGLTSIRMEQLTGTQSGDESGEVVQTWSAVGDKEFSTAWESEVKLRGKAGRYRVVAQDNAAGESGISQSRTIVFSIADPDQMAQAKQKLEEKAMQGLQQIIALQEQNIALTRTLKQQAAEAEEGTWNRAVQQQEEVRSRTRALLSNPVKPLGGRTEAVAALYANEMVLAVDALALVPTVQATQRARRAEEALVLESRILRGLSSAEPAMGDVRRQRQLSGISALLSALIESQGDILDRTKTFAERQVDVPGALVDQQDELSEDLSAFERTCESDAEAVQGSDKAFADLLATLARVSREKKIKGDMLMAAERLDRNIPGDAVNYGSQAHDKLRHLQTLLERIHLQQKAEKQADMAEALGNAKEKLNRLKAVHRSVQEALESIRGNADKDDELFDAFAEEYVELIEKNKESLLTIPTDLHVFSDLNVGNELVEDVFSVFQEVEQMAESEELTPEDVVELAYEKNEILIEKMDKAEDRIDDIEKWLGEAPDTNKVLTETIDREEMPESGIALGALATEVEDLISDLLEEQEDTAESADDGATTHAVSDMETGWEVMEGDISSFAAKGVSGNQTPDHKEQDGRSNVGRQGMSVGETAAGSGTISEGDANIEERRTEDPTQSGQVQLEGEADTRATGGGKLASGKADELGMSGGVKRMDSKEEGSWEGMAALMARSADTVYAKASLQNVRVDSLKTAAHHLRQADDAIASGSIDQLGEYKQRALAALRQARMELAAKPSARMDLDTSVDLIGGGVQSGPNEAPAGFKAQVADYYKLLNEEF